MIHGGKRVRTSPSNVGDRIPFSVTLTGNTIKTIHTFTDFGRVREVLIKVPTLAAAASVVLTLHDKDYQTAADARYTSPTLGETATYDIYKEGAATEVVPLDRLVHPGDTLRIAADAGAGTETVTGVIYEVGA